MPHCIIEYSKQLESQVEPDVLIGLVHEAAEATGLFTGNDIKTRAIAYEHYQTGSIDKEMDFIHVTAKILSGRSQAQKSALSDQILSALASLTIASASLTVDVRDMERESYAKRVL